MSLSKSTRKSGVANRTGGGGRDLRFVRNAGTYSSKPARTTRFHGRRAGAGGCHAFGAGSFRPRLRPAVPPASDGGVVWSSGPSR